MSLNHIEEEILEPETATQTEAYRASAEPMALDESMALKNLKPQHGIFKRFYLAMINPTSCFKDVDLAPRVLLPILFIALIGTLIAFLNMDFILETQRAAMIEVYRQQDLAIPADGFESMLKTLKWTTLGITGVGMLVSVIFKGVVAHLLSGLFGSEGSAKKAISVVAYSYGIVLLGSLLGVAIAKATGLDYLTFSPAMILGADQIGTRTYTLLSAIDVFSIWYLGVSAFGLSVIEKIKMSRALIVTLIPYVIAILASAAFQ